MAAMSSPSPLVGPGLATNAVQHARTHAVREQADMLADRQMCSYAQRTRTARTKTKPTIKKIKQNKIKKTKQKKKKQNKTKENKRK